MHKIVSTKEIEQTEHAACMVNVETVNYPNEGFAGSCVRSRPLT